MNMYTITYHDDKPYRLEYSLYLGSKGYPEQVIKAALKLFSHEHILPFSIVPGKSNSWSVWLEGGETNYPLYSEMVKSFQAKFDIYIEMVNTAYLIHESLFLKGDEVVES